MASERLTGDEASKILSQFIDSLNNYGKNSNEVQFFLKKYKNNPFLMKLMKGAIEVKDAFNRGIISCTDPKNHDS